MNYIVFYLFLALSAIQCSDHTGGVQIISDDDGYTLEVDGQPFFVQGMNWDYYPIGTNYEYNLWAQSDEFIKEALRSEMTLLRDAHVNAIRVYTGIPARWITYIHEQYGIYTMLNHSFGRYGLMLDGEWIANTDYADPRIEKLLLNEIKLLAEEYKNTPGLLFYLLGNENNYGLFWDGAETEDIPIEDRKSTQRAVPMYQLFNKGAELIKSIDKNHPVVLCNGDLQFLKIIKEECSAFDIYGTNMYRGRSFTGAFEEVKEVLDQPLLFTEFGADAFHAQDSIEDQSAQAIYVVDNWKEIYSNAAGLGQAENCIGGFTFQMSDGWWKYGQEYGLDVHDFNASWSNGGYDHDYVEGENNMNEEWFGVCKKGPTQSNGHYTLTPRKAFHALKSLHGQIDPYHSEQTLAKIDAICTEVASK